MSKDQSKKDLKVSPGDKAEKKSTAIEEAKGLLGRHPEILFNARHLFHNQNGQTVVEEVVPRKDLGEESMLPCTQYDVKEDEYQELINYAKKSISPVLKTYDNNVANEDALIMAIATYNDGRYANKINASTFKILLEAMIK
jgi:hypothetical protein